MGGLNEFANKHIGKTLSRDGALPVEERRLERCNPGQGNYRRQNEPPARFPIGISTFFFLCRGEEQQHAFPVPIFAKEICFAE